jgi:hypothetical protein
MSFPSFIHPKFASTLLYFLEHEVIIEEVTIISIITLELIKSDSKVVLIFILFLYFKKKKKKRKLFSILLII